MTQAFNRFLADSKFTVLPPAIRDVAAQAALDAQGRGDTEAEIVAAVKDALLLEAPVAAAYAEATTILSASLWGDTRERLAVDALVDSAAKSAAAQVIVSQVESTLKDAIEDAVNAAFGAIKAGPVFMTAPSTDYSGFVTATAYQAAATTAAKTAAAEAAFQYGAGVKKESDLKFLTNKAVSKALVAIRNQAAALPQSSLPLNGSLTAGSSVNGVIYLPALAPTNPFMHRQHPDHTEGYPITRRITMAVDASDPGGTGRTGYGVSRITGTYQEEIFGLHKPLGNNQDVGLKTRGAFTLNRISFVDTLNF